MRKLIPSVLCAAFLAGCESDVKKAERLEHERVLGCAAVMVYQIDPSKFPSAEERARCDVATRNYNKFMAGR
jgi:hypothetical protein